MAHTSRNLKELLLGMTAERSIDDLLTHITADLAAQPDVALARIKEIIATGLSSTSKGLAVFARAGEPPFFLTLQFQVPVPNWIAVDSTPNIYHLVELKDTHQIVEFEFPFRVLTSPIPPLALVHDGVNRQRYRSCAPTRARETAHPGAAKASPTVGAGRD